MKRRGRPKKKTEDKLVRFATSLTSVQYDWLVSESFRTGVPIAEIIRAAIEHARTQKEGA